MDRKKIFDPKKIQEANDNRKEVSPARSSEVHLNKLKGGKYDLRLDALKRQINKDDVNSPDRTK